MNIMKIIHDVHRVHNNKGMAALLLLISSRVKHNTKKNLIGTGVMWNYERARVLMECSGKSDADPLGTIWISPDDVEYCTGPINSGPNPAHLDHIDTFYNNYPFGDVKGGDWDKKNEKFTDLKLYKGTKQRIKNGEEWKNTSFYQNHRGRILNGRKSLNCRTISDLEKKFGEFDRLIDNINQNGYLPQSKLKNGLPYDEIVVNISRDGQFLFNGGGRHRLSVAKLLDIEKIPVLIKVRHDMWQYIRDEMNDLGPNDSIPEKMQQYLCHPDLKSTSPFY